MSESICIRKDPLKPDQFINNANKIDEAIKKNSCFVFYFSPDPDAVGASVALALYIRRYGKECIIYLPDGFDRNLDFLFDIAIYNNINVVQDMEIIKKAVENDGAVIVSCDTPAHFLLPNNGQLLSFLDEKSAQTHIEIDHHFGADSEQIFRNAFTLFAKTNSCCEIIAEFFAAAGFGIKDLSEDDALNMLKTYDLMKIDLDKYFPRNIVLSLLVGICFDTQLGKFVTNQASYDRWFALLSGRLTDLTWGDARKISTSQMVFDTINRMNETKKKTLERYVAKTSAAKGIGLLVMPPVDKYESLSKSKDSTCVFCKLTGDFSNMVPDFAGAVGIFAYYDSLYQLYYVKVRRTAEFKEYDLRELESLFNKVFKAYFLGGGGHEGATSFRIADIGRALFMRKIRQFRDELVILIGDKTAPYERQT